MRSRRKVRRSIVLKQCAASLVLAISLFVPRLVLAEEGALGLRDVIESARRHFPQVRMAHEEIAASRAGLRSAEGGFDPKWTSSATWEATGAYPTIRAQTYVEQPTPLLGASLFAGYRIGLGKFAIYDGKAETNDYGEVRGGLRIPILRDGSTDRRRTGIAQAKASLRGALAGGNATELDVERAASLRYWDWILAGERLRVANAWLALASSRDAQLGERANRGDIPSIDRDENRRTILQRENAVLAAERDLAITAQELSLYYRNEAGAPAVPPRSRLPDGIPPLGAHGDQEELVAKSVRSRPDLIRQRAAVERARLELEWAENQTLPALDIVGAASRDLGPGDVNRAKPVLEAGVVLDVPLFNRPARGRRDAARNDLTRLREQLRLAEERVSVEVRTLLRSHDTAVSRAKIAHDELELARKLANAEYARFQLGESTLLTVNIREQGQVEAELRYLEALLDGHRADALVRAAVGGKT